MSDNNIKICPYCSSEIAENDDYVICSVCRTPHHTECWRKNKRCAKAGCTGTSTSSGYGKTDSPFYINTNNTLSLQKQETLENSLTKDSVVAADFVRTALVGRKAEYYIPKFRKMDKKTIPISFNLWAFILGWYWCLYRKMYFLALVNIASQLYVFGLPIKWYYKYLIMVGVFFVNGLSGNYLYKIRIDRCCKKGLNLKGDKRSDYISKKQGVNIILPIVIFVLVSMVSLIQQYVPVAETIYNLITAN